MHRFGLTRLLRTFATLILVVGTTPLRVHATSELEQHLRDQYNGKTFVLRNFYHGDRLSYDSAGSLVSDSAVTGDWTVDGFAHVISLDLHGQSLTIQAERLSLLNNGQAFQFRQNSGKGKKNDEKKERKAEKGYGLRIDVEFDAAGITPEKADSALSRIFLTVQDRFADSVPAYWKPCALAASTGNSVKRAAWNSSEKRITLQTGGNQYDACRFPPELAAIPGLLRGAGESPESAQARVGESKIPDGSVVPSRRGVVPPKLVFSPDPAFPEQARKAKYQGTVTLLITVDETGLVRDIRIVGPLGMGLDQRAADTVSKWRFIPARRDDQPVAVDMAVEVDFHLH
jgi:TonB family protein